MESKGYYCFVRVEVSLQITAVISIVVLKLLTSMDRALKADLSTRMLLLWLE